MTLLRLLESIHGHLGILAAVALLHPAILLRRGKPLSGRARWSVLLTTAVTVLAFGFGLLIYGDYREHVKRPLLLEHYDVGMLFETKEHLAYAVLAMALGGAVAMMVAPRESTATRRAAAALYAMAALLCFVVSGLGTYVAAYGGFPQ